MGLSLCLLPYTIVYKDCLCGTEMKRCFLKSIQDTSSIERNNLIAAGYT